MFSLELIFLLRKLSEPRSKLGAPNDIRLSASKQPGGPRADPAGLLHAGRTLAPRQPELQAQAEPPPAGPPTPVEVLPPLLEESSRDLGTRNRTTDRCSGSPSAPPPPLPHQPKVGQGDGQELRPRGRR